MSDTGQYTETWDACCAASGKSARQFQTVQAMKAELGEHCRGHEWTRRRQFGICTPFMR